LTVQDADFELTVLADSYELEVQEQDFEFAIEDY
jgi:hypothetical protein